MEMLSALQPAGADGIFTRPEFLEEFEYRYKPGQHVILLGPTGRGKTTLAGKMLATGSMPKTSGLITIQLGPDAALQHLGKPTTDWPPPGLVFQAMMYDHKERKQTLIRRYQPLPKKPEHFAIIHRKAGRILRWMFGRSDWTLFVPDLQVVTDPGMMGLGKEVDQLLLTLRKRAASVWLDAQAPRWIPRSATDMTSHLLIWRNRDEDTMKRIKSIAGLDLKLLLSLFQTMDYHDCLWVDVVADEYYIVRKR